jgi:WD40 repeat protein
MQARVVLAIWVALQFGGLHRGPASGHPSDQPGGGAASPSDHRSLSDAERKELTIPKAPLFAGIRFLPQGDQFVVFGKSAGCLHVYTCSDLFRSTRLLSSHRTRITAFAVSPKHALVACAGEDGCCRVWDCRTNKEHLFLVRVWNPKKLTSVALSPDGSYCMLGGQDGVLHVVEIASGKVRHTVRLDDWITHVSMSSNGRLAAVCMRNGCFSVLGIPGFKVLATRKAHRDGATTSAFSPDGNLLVTGGMDTVVAAWNTRSWKCESRHAAHRRMVTTVDFSPTGKQFATGSADGSIIIWDAATGKRTRSIQTSSGGIRSLAFHPSASLIASVGGDIRFWNPATGKESPPPRPVTKVGKRLR